MNDQEAITRAEAWYLRRYHAVAAGHITLDAQGQELRDASFLCVDLVPERGTAVVTVVVDLTGVKPVVLLDEGALCPRCAPLQADRSGAGGQEAEAGGEEEHPSMNTGGRV